MDQVIAIIRKGLGSSIKPPSPSDRVASECCYSLDTPFSPGGLYLNLHTLSAASGAFVSLDRARSGASVYLHLEYTRVAVKEEGGSSSSSSSSAAVGGGAAPPTVLALGVPGGFSLDAAPRFTVAKKVSLVVFSEAPASLAAAVAAPGLAAAGARAVLPNYPSPDTAALPEFLATVVAAVLAHEERNASAAAASSAWAEDAPKPSPYAAALVQRPDAATGAPRVVSPNPADWVCDVPGCGKREGLWLNLTDGFIGCGRAQYGGTGGNGHALAHYSAGAGGSGSGSGRTGPLCVKLGTINASGGECYSYAPEEDDAVEDPQLGRHLAYFGINIMALEKTAATTQEQALSMNLSHDWSKLSESGSSLVSVSGPGRLGLENLGNTCYMNSVLQLLAAVPEWAAAHTQPGAAAALYASASGGLEPRGGSGSGGIRDDLPSQTARLLTGLLASPQYAATPSALAARTAAQAAAAAAAAASPVLPGAAPPPLPVPAAAAAEEEEVEVAPGGPCGYLVPSLLRRLVGKGHPEFSSSRQQDAPEFLGWLLSLHSRAATAGRAAGRALPPTPNLFFEFTTQRRLQDLQSGGVRYTTSPPEAILRLDIPEGEAVNASEVARIAALREACLTDPEAKRARLAELSTASSTTPTPVPLDSSGLPAPPKLHVPLAACLAAWGGAAALSDYLSPVTGQRGGAVAQSSLTSLPPYLCIALNRYRMNADWTTRKVEAAVPMPEELDLGAAGVLAPGGGGGLQAGEVPLPEAAAGAAGAAGAAPAPAPAAVAMDEGLVANLLSMGFPEGACRRAAMHVAAQAPPGTVEDAMEWIVARMEEPDFGAPYVAASSAASSSASSSSSAAAGAVDPASVASLCEMGFAEAKARAALKACGSSVERAMDWLMSHGDEEVVEEEEAAGGGGAGSSAAAAAAAPTPALAVPAVPANARYTLVGIVSHMGASLASGHYVAHIRKDSAGVPAGAPGCTAPQWLLYNDSKVALSQSPPLDAGLMYMYRRVEA